MKRRRLSCIRLVLSSSARTCGFNKNINKLFLRKSECDAFFYLVVLADGREEEEEEDVLEAVDPLLALTPLAANVDLWHERIFFQHH